MISFYPLSHYKFLQPWGEQDEQYWNKVAIKFLKQKHNVDMIRWDFSIKIYIKEPLHELYFIVLTLQEKLIIRPTKKIVISYMVIDLVLLD